MLILSYFKFLSNQGRSSTRTYLFQFSAQISLHRKSLFCIVMYPARIVIFYHIFIITRRTSLIIIRFTQTNRYLPQLLWSILVKEISFFLSNGAHNWLFSQCICKGIIESSSEITLVYTILGPIGDGAWYIKLTYKILPHCVNLRFVLFSIVLSSLTSLW